MATLTAATNSTATGYSDGSLAAAFGTFTGTLGGAAVVAIFTDTTTPNQIDLYTASGSFSAVNGKPINIDGTIYAQSACNDLTSFVQSTYTATGFSFVNTTVYAVDLAVYAGPAYVGVSTGAGSATAASCSFASSGRIAGDTLFALVETANQAVTIATAGFVEVPTHSPQSRGTAGAAGGVRGTLFKKWPSDGTETTVTTSDSGDHQYISGFVARGAGGAEVQVDVGDGNNVAATTSGSFGGVTTTGNDRLIAHFVATDRDFTGSSWGTPTNANLANLTKRFDNGTATGSGGGVAIITGEKLVAGATGNTIATQAASAAYCWITLALKNAAGGGGTLTGSASGTASIAGQRTASSPATASASGSGSATGRATAQSQVGAAGTGAASAVGQGIVSAALSASASGAGSIAGASVVVSAGAALAAGQGSGAIAGAASSTAGLASAAAGSGSVDGRSTRDASCAGAAAGSASITSQSSAAAAVSASGAGTGSVGGNAILPANLAASATGSSAVTGRSTSASVLSVTGSGAALISSASNTTVVGALASSGSASASIAGLQVVAASLAAPAAGQVTLVGTGVLAAALAALASSSGLAIGAASVSAEIVGAGVGLGQVSGSLINASALSGAGAGSSQIDGQRLVMATLNGVAVSSGAIVGLSRITLPASEARNVSTVLASRTANSNEPARETSTARPSRNALTAAQNRTAVSIRLPR